MEFFTSMPEVVYVHSKGTTKSMVGLQNGINCDLRIVSFRSFVLHCITSPEVNNTMLHLGQLHCTKDTS
jgi:DNA polymerase/3'-5' exonuclease PolX